MQVWNGVSVNKWWRIFIFSEVFFQFITTFQLMIDYEHLNYLGPLGSHCKRKRKHDVFDRRVLRPKVIACVFCPVLQTRLKPWPATPAAWCSRTHTHTRRTHTRCASARPWTCRTRRASCIPPSAWPTFCSTSRRWNAPRATASKRNTR